MMRYIVIIIIAIAVNSGLWAAKDILVQVQKGASAALIAHNTRMRVASENMANAQSVSYVPKTIYMQAVRDRKNGINKVDVKTITKDPKQVKQEYQPHHPEANAEGYVILPDVNPIVEMMNLQQAKHDIERSMKVYEIASDLRYKMIGMISNR